MPKAKTTKKATSKAKPKAKPTPKVEEITVVDETVFQKPEIAIPAVTPDDPRKARRKRYFAV